MITKECCGSCKNISVSTYNVNSLVECGRSNLNDIGLYDLCEHYQAFKMVESDYEKMWNKLRALLKTNNLPGQLEVMDLIELEFK